MRPEQLEELLRELASINTFEYSVETPDASDSLLTPLAANIKLVKRIVRFTNDAAAPTVREGVMTVVRALGLRRGRVIGKDQDGLEKAFKLLNTPDSFGRFEHDDLADENILNLSKVEDSPFLGEMLKAAHQNKSIFESHEA